MKTEILDALLNNNLLKVREHIGAGKAINIQNALGLNALQVAIEKGLEDIVALLLEHGANPNLVLEPLAVYSEKPDGAESLFQSILEDLQCLPPKSVLQVATKLGHTSIVDLLLNHGAEVNTEDDGGCTPLHWAALKGNIDLVRLLVEKGALVDAQDLALSTPLHEAVRHGQLKVVEYLLEQGAHSQLADIEGNTAFHLARHLPVIEQLLMLYASSRPLQARSH